MTDIEVLLDLVQFLAENLHPTTSDMSLDALRWQPDPDANNIAVTVWHIARLLDDLWTRAFDDRPMEDQVWMANGWSSRTVYDPRGIGWHGSGMLFGYTREEVAEVPFSRVTTCYSTLIKYAKRSALASRSCPTLRFTSEPQGPQLRTGPHTRLPGWC